MARKTFSKQKTVEVISEELLRLDYPSDRFIWAHNPSGWQWIGAEKRWLPMMNQLIVKNGVNGTKNGNPNTVISGALNKGFTVIKENDARLGKYKGYLYSQDVIVGDSVQKHYSTEFDDTFMSGKRPKTVFDHEGFHEFLQYLVDKGIVEPMEDFILEEKISLKEKQLSKYVTASITAPHLHSKVVQLETEIADMRAAFERQFGAPKEVRVKKTRAKAEDTDDTSQD